MQKPLYIMIHHTGVSYEKNPDQFRATNNYHKAHYNFVSSLGFYAGYNYEIAKNGKVYQARKDGEPTAACYQRSLKMMWRSPNSGCCIHIAIDGNFDLEKPKPEQIYALRDLLKEKCKQYGIKASNIYFHRDFAQKTCPGKNLDLSWVRQLPTR